MNIWYGGIKFEVVRLLDFERQPILDDSKVDYLFTKFTINAIALCNSQQAFEKPIDRAMGMSFVRDSAPGVPFTPAPAPGINALPPNLRQASDLGTDFTRTRTSPIITDNVIRHWLKVPRRQLFVTDSQGNQILRTPKPGFYVDANNGPNVVVYSVQEILGDARTFVVHFQVETYINECEENEGRTTTSKFASLISNRFSQHHELDEDYFLTIITQGIAHYRTDMIYTRMNPDDLRPFLFLPIPYGFKRVDIQVSSNASVNAIRYQFVDKQIPYQYVKGNMINATRASVNFVESVYSSSNPLGNVVNFVERYYGFKVNRRFAREADAAPPTAPPKRDRSPAPAKIPVPIPPASPGKKSGGVLGRIKRLFSI